MSTRVSQAVLMVKSWEGRLASPVSLASRIRHSMRPRPRYSLQVGQIGVGQVGNKHLIAVAVNVGETQLRAGMRLFAPHQHPAAGRPGRQADQISDLGHLAGLANLTAIG